MTKPTSKTYRNLLLSSMIIAVPHFAQAEAFTANIEPYFFDISALSETCLENDACPEIDISYLHSNHAWANDIVNNHISAAITGDATKTYKPIEFPAAAADASAEFDDSMVIPEVVEQALTDFAQEALESEGFMHSLSVSPDYLGHLDDIELFAISTYLYTGGAHGSGAYEYIMLDSKSKQQLKLEDLLIEGQKANLEAQLQEAYKSWLISNEIDTEAHESDWPFVLTENLMFTADGLEALYQQYEIGPYAMGMPSFAVSYENLDGIIKPEYLDAAKKLAQ